MPDISQWNVLLVDDEPDSLHLICDILSLNGARVFEASGGREAQDQLATMRPTLVVLDLSMPRPDGWDLLAQIRADPVFEQVPVVAVTAYYSEEVAAEAADAGFDAFFPKPVKVQQFLAALKQLVG